MCRHVPKVPYGSYAPGICFSIQPQLQLVNLHRNRRYFVIKLHTWFCLSYFLEISIKFYCIYQYLMSINSFFNTVSVSRYSRPITVTRDPLQHVPPVFSTKSYTIAVDLLLLWMLLPSHFKDENIF